MRRVMFVLALILFGATMVMFAPAAQAQPGSISFDPSSTVRAGGGKFFINVKCEANAPSFLISHAFANQPGGTEFATVPAISFTTSPGGTFGIGLTIDPGVPGGTYNVGLRCAGGAAASATLTVLSFNGGTLARTGAPAAEFATVGAIAVAAGTALMLFGRRRMKSNAALTTRG
jgi:hypothetical protein